MTCMFSSIKFFFFQADNAYFEFELSNYNAEFEVSPSNGQGQTTASILIKDTNLINYETGPTQYIFDVS